MHQSYCLSSFSTLLNRLGLIQSTGELQGESEDMTDQLPICHCMPVQAQDLYLADLGGGGSQESSDPKRSLREFSLISSRSFFPLKTDESDLPQLSQADLDMFVPVNGFDQESVEDLMQFIESNPNDFCSMQEVDSSGKAREIKRVGESTNPGSKAEEVPGRTAQSSQLILIHHP